VTATLETISEQRCFGGVQGYYRHPSSSAGGPMRFGVFVPSQAAGGRRPALYYLAGLECNEQTFAIKAGAQRAAAQLGLVLVTCDTSPRAARYPGDDASWDFGQSASFYLDATQEPWRQTYRMETYVTRELPDVVEASFPVLGEARGLFGHSMGGHGAVILALRRPGRYRSVSAFAPIVAPSQVPWGEKALGRYLGPDRAAWRKHDAVALIEDGARVDSLLVDQGEADAFLAGQLRPELLEAACAAARIPLTLRRRPGYDHSYYFISTFMADHLHWHAERLNTAAQQ
jgi:S-formylglutathione hydrolase